MCTETDPTRLVKYIFLDIVGYSSDRTVEAQTEIVGMLNNLVKSTLNQLASECERIYLPTGDGVCLAIIDRLVTFDVHIKFALEFLAALTTYNQSTKDYMRQFEVRIGLNENVDNLITDINGQQNVAGAGINMAQRVMSCGDGGTLLISDAVFHTLCHRERYRDKFKKYQTLAKHDLEIDVYQYIDESALGLNNEAPTKLANAEDPIEAILRRCLGVDYSTAGQCDCIYEAEKAWQMQFDQNKDYPMLFLDPRESLQYETILKDANALLRVYDRFVKASFAKHQGTMYLQMAAYKSMSLQQSLTLELRWLTSHLEHRRAMETFTDETS